MNSKSSAENIESKAQKQNQKPASRKASRQSQQDAFDPVKNRPLNRFNLFFILERERLLMEMNDQGDTPAEKETKKTSDLPPGIATGYEGLEMPELPPRFKDLTLREFILFVRVHFISRSDAMLFCNFRLDFRQNSGRLVRPRKAKTGQTQTPEVARRDGLQEDGPGTRRLVESDRR